MELKNLIEALLFASGKPLKIDEILTVLETAPERIPGRRPEIEEALERLQREWQERGGEIELVRVAEGYEFRTKPPVAPWLKLMTEDKPDRLTRRAMETLALIAYRQPITRVEIESLRGVDSVALLKNLLEKRLIRVVGRKEEAGRPLLYATSREFLELFGLKDLNDLPPLAELEEKVRKMPPIPDEELTIADLALTPEELSTLEEKDREVLGELEDRLKDLRTTEKEAIRRVEESSPSDEDPPLLDKPTEPA